MKKSQSMSKNSWSLFLAILIAGSIFMGSVWAEEYAPRVNPPKNITNRDFWVKTISGWKIPSKEDVGIPAYPGALIVNFRDTSSMTSNGKELVTLPIIVLETEDEQTKVAAFFKEQLKDWKYENKFGMFDVFWMEGEFNFMDIDQAATQPNVQIQAPIASEPDRMMPTSKTRIQIIYKTQK